MGRGVRHEVVQRVAAAGGQDRARRGVLQLRVSEASVVGGDESVVTPELPQAARVRAGPDEGCRDDEGGTAQPARLTSRTQGRWCRGAS